MLAGAVSPGGGVVGIDLDAERVAFAAERWASNGMIAVREGDHGALPFDDGAFDVAWASLVLHHARRPLAMLGEMRRVVRPGRELVAIVEGDTGGSFPVLPWPPDLEIALRRAAWEGARANHGGTLEYHYSGYIGRELPRLLREAGLAEVRVVACPDVDRPPLHPQRAAEIRGWFAGPFARRLRDFQPPRELARMLALFEVDSPTDLLASPDFFMVRTWFLAIGRV